MKWKSYVFLHVKLSKALHRTFHYNTARQLALEDWKRDAAATGHKHLTKTMFEDALFELCDLWTPSIEPREYVLFLTKLYIRVTKLVMPVRARAHAMPYVSYDVLTRCIVWWCVALCRARAATTTRGTTRTAAPAPARARATTTPTSQK